MPQVFKYTKEVADEAVNVRRHIQSVLRKRLSDSAMALVVPQGNSRRPEGVLSAVGVPININELYVCGAVATTSRDNISIKEDLGKSLESAGYKLSSKRAKGRWGSDTDYLVATPAEWEGRMPDLLEMERADERRRAVACGSLQEGFAALKGANGAEARQLLEQLVVRHTLSKTKVIALMAHGSKDMRGEIIRSLQLANEVIFSQASNWRDDFRSEVQNVSQSLRDSWRFRAVHELGQWTGEVMARLDGGQKEGGFQMILKLALELIGKTQDEEIEEAMVSAVLTGIAPHSALAIKDPQEGWQIVERLLKGRFVNGSNVWLPIEAAFKEMHGEVNMGVAVGKVLDRTWRSMVAEAIMLVAMESGHWGADIAKDNQRPHVAAARLDEALRRRKGQKRDGGQGARGRGV